MSQHDFNIANQTASSARSDLNNALSALASLSSGSTAPSTTYANMLWYDTGNNILKMRSEADDAWINIGTSNQSANTFQASYTPPFTAVQQGGGASQGTNKIYIGWDGGGLRLQVDSTDLGKLALQSQIPASYTDAQARSAQAGHGAGGVGSYAFLGLSVGFAGATVTINPGTTVSGADLRWAGTKGASTTLTSIVGYGQWLAMGYVQVPAETSGATLFLRTS